MLFWPASHSLVLHRGKRTILRARLFRIRILFEIHAMLTVLGSPRRTCDGLTRRETLQAGSLAMLGGFGLPSLRTRNELRPPRPAARPAKSVILLYLLGGAATQDMFDLKPNAPAEVRGEFQPIATNVPGIQHLRASAAHEPLDAQDRRSSAR